MKQHKFFKKGSLELSVNFIVVMIICLALIGVGFFLLAKGSDAFEKEYDKIKTQRESQIRTAMARSGESVLVYPNTITLNRGEGYIFSVGITNNKGVDENFQVKVETPAGQETDNEILYAPREEYFLVKNGETKFIPLKITSSKARGPKSYVFNVCVFAESNPGSMQCPSQDTYGTAQKIIFNAR
jgi:hypothetical protein